MALHLQDGHANRTFRGSFYIPKWNDSLRGKSLDRYIRAFLSKIGITCVVKSRKYVNDTLRMYKNDDIRMYNFNCITDTIVEVITTCNTYTLLTVHLL